MRADHRHTFRSKQGSEQARLAQEVSKFWSRKGLLRKKCWLWVATVFTLVFTSTALAQTQDIVVNISGVEGAKGTVRIALYNQADDFPAMDKGYKNAILTANKHPLQHVFSQLPHGYYALAAFFDENNNGKLDKNFIGIPQEKYAFSNNPQVIFSAPDFIDVRFKLDKTQHLNLYLK